MNWFINDRFNVNGEDWVPEDYEDLEINIKNLYETLSCCNFNNDVVVFYSKSGWNNLLNNLQLIDLIGNSAFNDLLDRLRALLISINSKNWEENRLQRGDINYYYQMGLGALPYYINDSTIGEAAEYKYHGLNVSLINMFSANFNDSAQLFINRVTINPPIDMQIISLNIHSIAKEAQRYLINNRTKRIYNHNPKHGENGRGMLINPGEIVSPLECSIVYAEERLIYAVSYGTKKELYALDKVNNKFIIYKQDNDSFHAYHPVNQNEVPNEAKAYLERIESFFIEQNLQ